MFSANAQFLHRQTFEDSACGTLVFIEKPTSRVAVNLPPFGDFDVDFLMTILDFFNIVYVENRGISFGIFSSLDASFYLGILSFLISGYIIFIIKLTKEFWEIFGLSLILGGAIGNGLDRVINNYVIDFLDFYFNDYHWPAFNFADSFITVGGVIFFWRIFFKKPLKK